MISYAQAREDVLLNRALHHVPSSDGFYIDVGGFDPDYDSVTRHFYEHGWHGINIEPNKQLFPKFVDRRPRDINMHVAVTEVPGEVTFYEIDNGQLGTLEERFAQQHVEEGMTMNSYTVPALTLAQICEQHVTGDIHFLKIDVEGHEGAVIRGMNFERWRPWVLVIEATEPNRLDRPTYQEWDSLVQQAGYLFLYTDVLNRYYVAREHPSLFRAFVNGVDDYVYDRVRRDYGHRLHELTSALETAKRRVAELEDRLPR